MGRMGESGLEPQMDEVANVYGRNPNVKRSLLIGSHTDTVPHGGWLGGALGVVYGLEIARAAMERGDPSPIGIDVISFQDEEGTFLAFLGSRTFCNDLTQAEIDAAKSGDLSLRSALAAVPGAASPPRLHSARHLCSWEPRSMQGSARRHVHVRIGIRTGLGGVLRVSRRS